MLRLIWYRMIVPLLLVAGAVVAFPVTASGGWRGPWWWRGRSGRPERAGRGSTYIWLVP